MKPSKNEKLDGRGKGKVQRSLFPVFFFFLSTAEEKKRMKWQNGFSFQKVEDEGGEYSGSRM